MAANAIAVESLACITSVCNRCSSSDAVTCRRWISQPAAVAIGRPLYTVLLHRPGEGDNVSMSVHT